MGDRSTEILGVSTVSRTFYPTLLGRFKYKVVGSVVDQVRVSGIEYEAAKSPQADRTGVFVRRGLLPLWRGAFRRAHVPQDTQQQRILFTLQS